MEKNVLGKGHQFEFGLEGGVDGLVILDALTSLEGDGEGQDVFLLFVQSWLASLRPAGSTEVYGTPPTHS